MWLSDQKGKGKEVLRDMAYVANEESKLARQKDKMGVVREAEDLKTPEVISEPLINLTINEGQMDRSISDEDKKVVEKFLEMWNSGNVVRIGLGVRNGEITTIALAVKDGDQEKKVFLSATVFRKVLDGVKPYRENSIDDPTGLLFESKNGASAYIEPHTNPDRAKRVFSNISIEGKKLSQDFTVVFAPTSGNRI